ncbi:MAG TPA: hypothetical protein VGM85_18000 [Paraburkholderia sp.]|jgi:hypothetical protein
MMMLLYPRFLLFRWGSVMHFCYRACTIDATPVFSLGRYVAQATIVPSQDLSEASGDGTESRDLGDFDSEADAVAFAHKWAIDWIDGHLNPVVCRSQTKH